MCFKDDTQQDIPIDDVSKVNTSPERKKNTRKNHQYVSEDGGLAGLLKKTACTDGEKSVPAKKNKKSLKHTLREGFVAPSERHKIGRVI